LGRIGYGLNLLDIQDSKIRFPTMEFKQRVVIGAQVARSARTGNSSGEHAAQGDAIDIASLYPESNDPPCELIRDDEHSVGLEQDGIAAKQINAPQAVFHVTDESEPRGASIMRWWAVVLGEDTPHDVLVDVDTKGSRDAQGDLWATESGIALLAFDDRPNEVLRWTTWASSAPILR